MTTQLAGEVLSLSATAPCSLRQSVKGEIGIRRNVVGTA
jgi:hypothetical protein